MTNIKFTKMHGIGNDFVVIDATKTEFTLTSSQVSQIANRHKGIGFDQLLVIESAQRDDLDFNYRIYNSDGSEVEHCGNGARCFGKFVHDKGLITKSTIRVSTMRGVILITKVEESVYEIDMGNATTSLDSLPFIASQCARIDNITYEIEKNHFVPVSVGNPHAVMFVSDIDTFDVKAIAETLQAHTAFPNQVNVGFMEIVDKHNVFLRVYERGAGETLACGTGACAAVFAGIKKNLLVSPVEVSLRGGLLTICVEKDKIKMTGEAKTVFEGTILV